MSSTEVSKNNPPAAADAPGERRIRGKALSGAEQKESADHSEYEKRRNPDTELRLDGEKDSLYDDGLDIEDDESDTDTLAGTRGTSSGIKP